MNPKKRQKLEEAGWKVGSAEEFLGLTAEERVQVTNFHFPKIPDYPYKGFTLKQTVFGASCPELKWQCFDDDYDLIIFKFRLYVDKAVDIYERVKTTDIIIKSNEQTY